MRNRMKQITACFMASALVVMAGCGKTGESLNDLQQGDGSESASSQSGMESDSKEKAMGRYVESDILLPESISMINSIEKLEDGTIALLDSETGMYLSTDGGQNFTNDGLEIVEAIAGKYVWDSAIGKDGSVFINYMDGEGEDTQAGETIEEGEEADVSENSEVIQEEKDEDGDSDYSLNLKYIYIDKDKNIKEITLPGGESELYNSFCATSNGKILASNVKDVYLIDPETEECEIICSSTEYIDYIKEIRNRIYIVGAGKLEIYNLDTGSFEEDKVLANFIGEMGGTSYGANGISSLVLCEGEDENSLYITYSGGVYRHVMQGTVVEEVIKGGLSSMGSPTNGLTNVLQKGDNEFLICYNSSLLKNYTYDASISSVPENELTIYSLEENMSIRQAINLYQNANPDAFFQYEVGLTQEDGMTREDAIRELNTRLLSGEGPDIILLDDMPIEPYIQKGVLADLSSKIQETYQEGDLQEAVMNTYKRGENIYALPSFYSIPVLVTGEKESPDLKGLADKIEELREENPQGSITGSYIEEMVLESFYNVSSVAWQNEDGTIDREKLTEFLTETKRIYQAEVEGVTQEETKQVRESYMVATQSGYSTNVLSSMEYISGRVKLLFGEANGIMDYNIITSVLNKKNETASIVGLNGLAENVFVPNTILGVNETSSSKEAAIDFVLNTITADMQGVDLGTGFPINKEARDKFLENPSDNSEDEEVGVMGMSVSGEDGFEESLEVVWSSEEQIEDLKAVIENLTTPAYVDSTLKNAVLEMGKLALNGEKSVDDAVNEIINKMQIYLSE